MPFNIVARWRNMICNGRSATIFCQRLKMFSFPTGSPSSNYEHRRASALLRNIQNIRICMGKKPIVPVTYENERISIKNSLPYLKCVLRLSCVVHGPIYGPLFSYCVNGSKRLSPTPSVSNLSLRPCRYLSTVTRSSERLQRFATFDSLSVQRSHGAR